MAVVARNFGLYLVCKGSQNNSYSFLSNDLILEFYSL